LKLHQHLYLARDAFNEQRVHFRRCEESTRWPGLPVDRDRVLNALANRCLSLADSCVHLCRAGLDDDAYALGRILFEATLHLELMTGPDWQFYVDTYDHYRYALKLRDKKEFLDQHPEIIRRSQAAWDRMARICDAVFGPSQTWLTLPAERVPLGLRCASVKGRSDLRRLPVHQEYRLRHPRADDAPEPFFTSWMYGNGSSYVHTDCRVSRISGARPVGPAPVHAPRP
jgi:hypothetical protein